MPYPHSRYHVDVSNPRARGNCDRCNFTFQLHQLRWQFQWAGPRLQNLRILVCRDCYDIPQMQLRSIIIPADPVPVLNPRPENYFQEVTSFVTLQTGTPMATAEGVYGVTEIAITPDPSAPGPGYLDP